MSDYLRDSFIPFHTIGNDELNAINSELQAIVSDVSSSGGEDQPLQLQYTLRYDEMGIGWLEQAIVAAGIIGLLSLLIDKTWQVLVEAGSSVIK